MLIQLKRAAGLLNDAVTHHHNLIAHGHRFDLIVGHVDRGCLQALMQGFDLGAHLHA